MWRARRISTTFGRVYLGLRTQRWIERRLAPSDMEARWRGYHRDSARLVYGAAVDLHGLILKACQLIGTRADVMPREWVEQLAVLQDRVPAHPWPVVREWRPFAHGRRGKRHQFRRLGAERVPR